MPCASLKRQSYLILIGRVSRRETIQVHRIQRRIVGCLCFVCLFLLALVRLCIAVRHFFSPCICWCTLPISGGFAHRCVCAPAPSLMESYTSLTGLNSELRRLVFVTGGSLGLVSGREHRRPRNQSVQTYPVCEFRVLGV